MRANVIQSAFRATLKSAGFQSKNDNWYKHTEASILVINLQKSEFGDQFYVNLGIWLKTLGEAIFPKEHQCHIRLRAVALDRERQRYWESQIFDLEYRDVSDANRVELIREFLGKTVLPFLFACSSLPELRRLYREGRFKGGAVMIRAQETLES